MGDSAPNDRRRYARPGEFEIPDSVLETNSFRQRLGGHLNAERKDPVPVSRELRAEGELRPVSVNRSPSTGEPPSSANLNRYSGNAIPVSRDLGSRGDLRSLRPAPGPIEVEARLNTDLNQRPRNNTPASRELGPSGDLRPLRPAPGPIEVEARLNAGLRQRLGPPPIQVSRESRLNSELNPVRRNPMPLAAESRLSVDLNKHRRVAAPLTSGDAFARRRVSARFELLPEPKSRLSRIGWSAVGQLAALSLLLLSPMIFPQQMQTALKFDVVELMQPVTHINLPPETPPPPPPKIKPKVKPPEPKPIVPKPKPVEVEPPKLAPKQPHVFLVLKPELPKLRTVEAKAVDLKPMFAQAEIVLTTKGPRRPKEELKAPIFQPMRKAEINAPSLGSGSLPATVVAAANKVQTGGFGDLNGMKGPANPSKAANINQAGSPNLPGGPGYGNGTGGAQGARGTLASTGGPKGNGAGSGAATEGVTSGVNILSEPNPAYSTEARTLRLEGDVVLEVIFLASGQMQVIGVVSGLGHGLDEAAIQAAKLIRFRPAQRNGQPVDFHARVRIEFRLAN